MIEAVLFDMDGLLIDSEPFWRRAEVEVLRPLGVPLTEEMCLQTMGFRLDESIHYWYVRYPWSLADHPLEVVAEHVMDRVIELVRSDGAPLPGVPEVLDFFQERGLPMAIASSSYERVIAAVVDRLNLRARLRALCSAEHELYGKPHPAVYLSTARAVGVAPEHCLVFEDSLNGVISAKAARMRCVAVPAPGHVDPRFVLADAMVPTLSAFDAALWSHLNAR